MSFDDKILKLIIEFNRLTREKIIKWFVMPANKYPSSLRGGERLKGHIFTTKFEEKGFRLYGYQSKYYNSETDSLEEGEYLRFELIDDDGITEWDLSDNESAVSNLYQTVQLQTSDIKNITNSILDIIQTKYSQENRNIAL